MRSYHKTCLFLCILFLALLSGCGEKDQTEEVKDSTSETDTSSAVSDSNASITFDAQTIDGASVSGDVFSNSRITMVNVWATYCNPCLSEMPGLGELAKAYDTEDFQLIGIISDVAEDAQEPAIKTASELIGQTGADYPHLLLNESLYRALLMDVSAVPTTFFISQDGQILDTVVGAMEKSAWEETINALLEQ
ncbi:MAG: TlpA family protein disulfide reductase [Lachnospiraceae bacterium]|nr:TlpA family protein disulfide reductase [Lachnospiraceae bacterium]